MSNLTNFYNSIINIKNNDRKVIEKVVLNEKSKLLNDTNDLSGFCKYLAYNIQNDLNEIGVNNYFIDLNQLIGIDHVILIADYKESNNIKRVLIDPTFIQFVRRENLKLLNLKQWPSDKMNKNMCNNLINYGMSDIDNSLFNNYINSFINYDKDIDLDKYLIDKKLNFKKN